MAALFRISPGTSPHLQSDCFLGPAPETFFTSRPGAGPDRRRDNTLREIVSHDVVTGILQKEQRRPNWWQGCQIAIQVSCQITGQANRVLQFLQFVDEQNAVANCTIWQR